MLPAFATTADPLALGPCIPLRRQLGGRGQFQGRIATRIQQSFNDLLRRLGLVQLRGTRTGRSAIGVHVPHVVGGDGHGSRVGRDHGAPLAPEHLSVGASQQRMHGLNIDADGRAACGKRQQVPADPATDVDHSPIWLDPRGLVLGNPLVRSLFEARAREEQLSGQLELQCGAVTERNLFQ